MRRAPHTQSRASTVRTPRGHTIPHTLALFERATQHYDHRMAFPVRTRLIWRSVHLARFAGTDSSKQVRKSAHVWPAAGRGESINATTASNRERIASIRQPPVDVKEAIDAIEAETRILREEDPGSQFLCKCLLWTLASLFGRPH